MDGLTKVGPFAFQGIACRNLLKKYRFPKKARQKWLFKKELSSDCNKFAHLVTMHFTN